MTNHTPGTWIFDEKYEDINANGNRIPLVGIVTPMTSGPRRDEAKANARLIAAAPDLLGELKCAVSFMKAVMEERGDSGVSVLIRHAEAAIAKATGANHD